MFYNIAGLVVQMDTFGITAQRAQRYLCDPVENPDFVVSSKMLVESGFDPKRIGIGLSEDQMEHTLTQVSFFRELLNFNGLRVHSSAVVVDGKAYLFTADSGTGKSTHTRLWLKLFGDKGFILNDDKPAVRFIDGQWYAYGTPWSGSNDISVNIGVPIGGIAFLERGKVNTIEPFYGIEAVHALLKQSNRNRDMEHRLKAISLIDKFVSIVPMWKLKCNMDLEAAIISYEAMSGQKIEKEN